MAENTDVTKCVDRPPLSIGVVTHERATAFAKLLSYLIPAIEYYAQRCEVLVANNSGASAHEQIESIVAASGIRHVCECRVIDSSENNISTGRNLVLEHANEENLVFIDDDEYPISSWLIALIDAKNALGCSLVAGPILPVFPAETEEWVRAVDLHNCQNLATGEKINYAASGNFLINRSGIEHIRFNPSLGKSGGEDTDFFLQLKDLGFQLYWCREAIVYEDIPNSKATANYMKKRFMTQGRNYRTIKEQRGEISNAALFVLRAAFLAVTSIAIARVLVWFNPSAAAKWMKRGYSNLGKFSQPSQYLYE